MKTDAGLKFIVLGLSALAAGLIFGAISAFQFIFPDFFELVPFFKTRPLHVSLVVAWIFSGAVGGIYHYLPRYCNLPLYSCRLSNIHWWIFLVTGALIVLSYLYGKFGGREYWEFPPILALPIVVGWVIFGINFFMTVIRKKGSWPVYIWMWGTGIFYFLFTFLESYLWVFPFFKDNAVRELTMQWKSYGALVGSWNMLVYGTAIFLMEKISNDKNIGLSKITYLLYLLGLINLMFGWAHHIYIIPSAPWIRLFAYAISMTELLILGKIIWTWSRSARQAAGLIHVSAYRFLFAADIWIFINLALALAISVPAINLFSHGTHITVAHAMGSTIGINTMILISSVLFLTMNRYDFSRHVSSLNKGLVISNISLFIFFMSLVLAGVKKGAMTVAEGASFQQAMEHAMPFLYVFALSGIGILVGCMYVLVPVLSVVLSKQKNPVRALELN
jgi:nitric oxide reductase subunit B